MFTKCLCQKVPKHDFGHFRSLQHASSMLVVPFDSHGTTDDFFLSKTTSTE